MVLCSSPALRHASDELEGDQGLLLFVDIAAAPSCIHYWVFLVTLVAAPFCGEPPRANIAAGIAWGVCAGMRFRTQEARPRLVLLLGRYLLISPGKPHTKVFQRFA